MKKKFLTLMLAFVMMTVLLVPSFAATESDSSETEAEATAGTAADPQVTEGNGGLDFYSITINYENPILVDYTSGADSKFLFNDKDNNAVMADKYVYRAGVSRKIDYIGADKTPAANKANFYQLASKKDGIYALADYSNFPYSYAYITHIQDGTILKSDEIISLYGITAPYDDGEPYGNKNPNCNYDSDGYALDAETDADGNPYRIDINGYRITKDYLWLDTEGRRVELFFQKARYTHTGKTNKGGAVISQITFVNEWVAMDFEMRFDENNRVRNIKGLYAWLYVTNDEYNAFRDNNKDVATPDDPQYLYMKIADAEMTEYFEKNQTASGTVAGYRVAKSYAHPYSISKDVVAEDVPEMTEPPVGVTPGPAATRDPNAAQMTDEAYFDPTARFTPANIQRDKDGRMVTSTPITGTPKLNVKIKSITVEIDALGSQTYTDPAADPQNKNTLTVSLNDFERNILARKEALDTNYITQADYDAYAAQNKILGTVNSKTTSTQIDWNKDNVRDTSYKNTVVSLEIPLTEEELAALPLTATFYLTFHIQEHQPSEAYDTKRIKTQSGGTSLSSQRAELWERPSATLPPVGATNTNNTEIPWALIGGIAGGVVVVAAIAVVIGVTVSKKNKAKKS